MDITKLIRVANKDLSYNEADKKIFHAECKKVLKVLAKKMDLKTSEFKVSSNKAGIACSGQITLHTDSVYISVSQSMGKPNALYRSCEGITDYSGGSNNYYPIEKILDDSFVIALSELR